MTIHDFTTDLFVRVDDAMTDQKKHHQAILHPSYPASQRTCHARNAVRPQRRRLPRLLPLGQSQSCGLVSTPAGTHTLVSPERTRLFRLLAAHQDWTEYFLAQPSLLGVVDSFGIELIHPRREGRSPKQIGKKGKSNHRWIVGAKLCFVLDHLGRVVDWAVDTANVYDAASTMLLSNR